MADVAGDITTTAAITVGSEITNAVEVVGDHDWYRAELTAGQKVSIAVNLISLEDSYLYLRDASGAVLAQNDDGGGGRGSRLIFTAPTTGTYFIDVSAWENDGTDPEYVATGAYTLSLANYVMPTVGTLDEFAYQMTHGFFGGDYHHFNVTQGGTITVNFSGITAQGKAVALAALQQWTDIIGVNFVEVAGEAQITFDDLDQGTGAFANAEHVDHITSTAIVNVATYRINLHTYMHEIGHALGIGHTSNSNAGTVAAVYPDDAIWSNDGAAISIMSYFDNGENIYYADQGFSNVAIMTPQVADIIAMGNLYGLSTTTRLGDTTYGYNTNSGRAAFDPTINPNVGYTILDSGGIDTLDYSGFASNQLINLNAEAFSNIGTKIGNVVIARGTVIENAIGGQGADTLVGNAVANVLRGNGGVDMLTGGAGSDTFLGTVAEMTGDIITDFAIGDRILLSDASISSFQFYVDGNTLNFSGGWVNLPSGFSGQLVASSAVGGGVQLTAIDRDPSNDFNGDGRSDILWRDANGVMSQWLGQADGSFAWNPASMYTVPGSWTVEESGDYNGDGRDDILWRDGNGTLSQWLGQADGSFAWNPVANYQVLTSWTLEQSGDFNGDGRDDILWRDEQGTLSQWLGQENGSFAWNPASMYAVLNSWTLEQSSDFNGDGRSDILWRDENGTLSQWLGQESGSFAWNPAAMYQVLSTWSLKETGDYNGDGRSDILWRDSGGTLSQWLGRADGTFAWNPNTTYQVLASWSLEQSGDYNGDGRDDILWRDGEGTLSQWLGQADGSFAWNPTSIYQVLNSWTMQPSDAVGIIF